MKLATLQFAPTIQLPASLALYRIQRSAASRSTVKIGSLRLPPPTLLNGRFDLDGTSVGYFAESPETAAYETFGRRESTAMSASILGQRALLCVQTTTALQLLDLRPHASTFPVLQSLRFTQTQELAEDAALAGFQGIVYRSSQQFGMDCYAVFGVALRALRANWSEALVEAKTGNLHGLVATILLGSQLPLVP